MKVRVVAVIPARMGSKRFGGKVLFPYRDRPLIYHVWRRVSRAATINQTLIATDSDRIAVAVAAFGAEVVRTSRRHRTGSDRVAEAIQNFPADIVINVQADCFGLQPALLDRVIRAMRADRTIESATLARPIESDAELFDPGVVKVVSRRDGQALWFSRFPLPYLQNVSAEPRHRQFRYLAHIGVYFFRRPVLEAYAGWKRTAPERAESLEQLRLLENGGRMQVFKTSARVFSIDTPEDLKKIAK